jgi:hypothetical protein
VTRLIAIIVLATFLPMQAYAARPLVFAPVEREHLLPHDKSSLPPVSVPVAPQPPLVQPTPPVPAAPVAQPEPQKPVVAPVVTERERTEKLTAAPLAPTAQKKSGTNWWLWGGLGLLAVAGGIFALVGGKGGGSGAATTTATVNASW